MSRRELLLLFSLSVLVLATIGLVARIQKSTSAKGRALSPAAGEPEAGRAPLRDHFQDQLKLASGIFEVFTGDLDEIRNLGRIRVLTTNTYVNFFTYEGEHHGYEYNLMEEYERFLNARVGRGELKMEMYYIPLPYDLLIPALMRGYGDIVAANMPIHPERSKDIDFTDPYQWGIQEVLVSNEHIGDIDSIGSLSGRTICVREGSSYHLSLLELNKRLTDASRQPVDIVALPGVVETGDILEMVSADVVQMTVANSHIAGIAGKVLPNLEIHDHLVLNEDVRYGWMVRKSNPRLRESLNGFIQTIKKGTLKGNIYFERYFNENPWGRVALKREDFDMCCQFVPLFRKYGELYGVDWMLLAAQAYQESRFDPEAVSPDGAMGLMQLLPKTAREMGIENILHPEDNIHAAVKYLKWIMDHYFTRPEISSDDRVRFALAAYNAGPKKIRKARRVTATMGYDSSKWFGNAELGTLRHVGPEPVQYVRSVNKNYLAFLLSKVTGDIKQQRLDESISLSDRGEEDE